MVRIEHNPDEQYLGTYPPTCAICEKLTWDIVGTLQKRTVAVECHKAHWYYYEAQTLTDWRKLMLTAATCEDFEENIEMTTTLHNELRKENSMRYFVHIVQRGEGCDYTIGCGHSFEEIKASSFTEAIDLITADFIPAEGKEHADFAYTPDEIKEITVYEVKDSLSFDIMALSRRFLKVLHQREMLEKERLERQQYESLKAKYG